MKCLSCGENSPDSYSFCPFCGNKLGDEQNTLNTPTFGQLFEEWNVSVVNVYASNTKCNYMTAFKRMSQFHDMPITSISYVDVQHVLNGFSRDCAKPIRSLCGKLCSIAMERGVMYHDWSKQLRLPKDDNASRRNVFSEAEITALWKAYHAAWNTSNILCS